MCENSFVFHRFKIVDNFLMLRTGKTTKWRDLKDTERNPQKTKNKGESKKKKMFPWYFMLSHRSGNSNSRPSYASGEFFTAYLCRNSWKGILLGKPFRQIRIPSSTPLHLSWCKTRLDSITPAFLCSLGTMQRTKWGQVLYRVSISRVSCSLMKIWTQLACKSRKCISTMKAPWGTCFPRSHFLSCHTMLLCVTRQNGCTGD